MITGGLLQFWRVTVCPWVRRRLAASAPAPNLPALDENGDAAGQSSHAAGCGVNTELLINKMPQPAWTGRGQAAETTTITKTTTEGCETQSWRWWWRRWGPVLRRPSSRGFRWWVWSPFSSDGQDPKLLQVTRIVRTERQISMFAAKKSFPPLTRAAGCVRPNWQLTLFAQRQKTGSECCVVRLCPKSRKTAFPVR